MRSGGNVEQTRGSPYDSKATHFSLCPETNAPHSPGHFRDAAVNLLDPLLRILHWVRPEEELRTLGYDRGTHWLNFPHGVSTG